MNEIQLKGVRVHNLKSIDLDLPYEKLIVFCGVSGSGKSSLAMDTLYAEGQRRYIESFSAYTRQFLEKLERPEADQLDGIPAAAAVTARTQNHFTRATIGTATESIYYLRLLFSKIGTLYCIKCGREVRRDSPENILEHLKSEFLPPEKTPAPESCEDVNPEDSENPGPTLRMIIAFEPPTDEFFQTKEKFEAQYREFGFLRGSVLGKNFRLDQPGGIPKELYREVQKQRGVLEAAPEKAPENEDMESEKDSFSDRDFYDPELENESDFPPLLEDALHEGESEESNGNVPQSDSLTAEDEELDEMRISSCFVSGDGLADVGVRCNSPHCVCSYEPREDGNCGDSPGEETENASHYEPPEFLFHIDRLVLGKTDEKRIRDSLETALSYGEERCFVLLEKPARESEPEKTPGEHVPVRAMVELDETRRRRATYELPLEPDNPLPMGAEHEKNSRSSQLVAEWNIIGFSRLLTCEDCRIDYPGIEPKLFSFNSPLGACPICEGFGNLVTFDLDLIIPHKGRSIKDGAIAPWNTPSYKSRLAELLKRSEELGIPVDVPFETLTVEQRRTVLYGNESVKYEGLSQFFDKLQKQKYKMHIRVFLSRWRSYRTCPACKGTRLRPESSAVKIGDSSGGKNIADLCGMKIVDALQFLETYPFNDWEKQLGKIALFQCVNRLRYLSRVGLGYLTLDRTMRTLSGGEQRRIGLTSALGSSLVNMLYVLDEPSIGLHPRDTDRLLDSILGLRDRGNTVVVVEHEEAIIRAADRIVEIGPGAGQSGGQLVFQGTPGEMERSKSSLTGSYLSGERSGGASSKRRKAEHGFIELFGASGHNLKTVDVAFPLGVFCLITGVSGSGKSTLIQETLYPVLARKLGKENVPKGLPCTQILGTGQIDDVVMVDQSSIGRSPRSNPVTYLKIFDDIRNVFAETPDAKTRNFGAGHFSFNVEGGRCNTCKGDGYIAIDMQFMADMYVKCPQCRGKRYQKEVLEILYRGKNIADVLDMTAREAFSFFRGQKKVQQKLKRLMDVGLDYVRLGQPANTLSGGESQRLKLATYLSTMKKGRCVFLLDEPTTGLHFSDIVQLIDCFDALIDTGHSLIVVEHNLQMMKAADYIIDLGPGPAEEGGKVVASGTPEQIAACSDSFTGRFLREKLSSVQGES